ncbi:MAG TPA: GNAT family N-acetyltransferase [Nostocaceae cyanobacterium]|nr:GNAT family N-acetyltransferase [Nostocaceae cyanobacterium]
MSQILTDLSTPDLIPALQNNLWRYFTNYSRVPKGEFFSDSYLTRFFTGISYPLLNGVFNAQLPLEKIDTIIEETLDYFRTKQVPMVWWVGTETQPSDLGKYLEAQGLSCVDKMPVMAMDLSTLPQEQVLPQDLAMAQRPPLAIAQVQDSTTLEHLAHIAGVSFEIPSAIITEFYELELSLGLKSKEYIRFIAYWQGSPVATSALYLDEQVAGIYLVATVPEARGKGVATALVSATLQHARQLGYHIATLQASKMGVNVYRRLGFQEFYRVHLYAQG